MEKDDEFLAICNRVGGDKNHIPATTGIEAFCNKCNHKVWLSDTTISAIKERNPEIDLVKTPPKVLCIPCGLEELEKMESPEILPLTKTQTDEIIEKLTND